MHMGSSFPNSCIKHQFQSAIVIFELGPRNVSIHIHNFSLKCKGAFDRGP